MPKIKVFWTLNCVFVWALLFLSVTNLSAIPAGFNIQGRLTNANGINENGDFSIKFSIFPAASGGTPVWETKSDMPPVQVQNGNFQVVLRGEGIGIGGTRVQLEDVVKDLADAYVEIKVGSDPALAPRQLLLRSPFSSADKVTGKGDVLIQSDSQAAGSGLIAMRTGNTDRVTILNNGNVGIGVVNPTNALEVAGNAAFGGSVDIGLEIVTTQCGGYNACELQCPAGKRVLGGGCQLQYVASNLWRSFPISPYTWYCGYTDWIKTHIYVYAICARVK